MVYIPIWLDLLLICIGVLNMEDEGLHSNMVRFIIKTRRTKRGGERQFTFQYG